MTNKPNDATTTPNLTRSDRPVTILFACRQNAGRSQIAAAIAKERGGPQVMVLSAGSEPAKELHPETLEVLAEIGLAPISETPRKLDPNEVEGADWVITMGCGEACPVFPGTRYEDWEISDPSGQSPDKVRAIRDEIAARVDDLLNRVAQTLTDPKNRNPPL